MRKLLKRYLIVGCIAVLLLLFFFYRPGWLSSLKNIFKAQPVVIDNTPILIKEINELAELCTVTAFDEVIADSAVIKIKSPVEQLIPDLSGFAGLPITGKRIVIIGRGKVVAGVDLKQIKPADIFVAKDSIALTLPKATILDAIINPSGFETFSETGEWSTEAVTAVKVKARNKMINRALEQHILEKATTRSIMLMENFLRSSGFKKVVVKTL